MLKKILLPALLLALGACQSEDHQKAAAPSTDERFDNLKQTFLKGFWQLNPEWATSVGYHKFDSLLVIPDSAQRMRDAAFYATYQQLLAELSPDSLSAANRLDYRMLTNQLQAARWYADTLRPWTWNPAQYNLGATVGELLNSRHAGLDRRLRNISDKINHSTEYYFIAKANLHSPTREHTELAIRQCTGGLESLGPALLDSVRRSGLSAQEKEQLTSRIYNTRLAIESYVAFLKADVLPGPHRSARIGEQKFNRKFALDIESRFTAAEVYGRAQAHKRELLRDMAARATRLYPKYLPGQTPPADTLQLIRQVVDKLTRQHAPRNGFVAAIKAQIPTLVAFVNEHQLLAQDPSKPLVVRETPLYMRGSGAGASISAPGPYDKAAPTYYNVEPIPADWSADRAESYLREYNDYTLQILNIHEAIPGHYTQLVYANRSPSLIKSVFGNGAMVEGWAVYAERMMLEQGYGANSDEMWLLWDKWNMRSTLNTILDHAVQVDNISEKEALALLMGPGFQEEAEARGKWLRATLSQVQLSSYFTGYTEIMALRDEVKQQQGGRFNLKNFHEEFLSFGSAPVKYIREMMLRRRPA